MEARYIPRTGRVMLEKHAVQRVRDGISSLFFAPYADGEARFFGVFCRNLEGEEFDVMMNLNYATPADVGEPLRFKSLTALFDWYRKNHPSGEALTVSMKNIDTRPLEKVSVPDPQVASADSENDQARLLAIKGALRARGSSFAAVARSLGLTPAAVRNVCLRQGTSKRVEDEVSRILGLNREQLFFSFKGYEALLENKDNN